MPLLSNDPNQMTILQHQKKVNSELQQEKGKYYEFETRTRRLHPKTTESIIYLHFTFILRAIPNKAKKTLSMCTLSFLRQRYFRFISDF